MVGEQHSAESQAEISDREISALVLESQASGPRAEEAFAELIRLLEPRLHGQAFFLTGHEQHTLDLLQETLLEAWKHRHRYDGRARFFTWICSIMIHRHYDSLRRLRMRVMSLFEAASHLEHLPEPSPDPSEHADEIDRASLIRGSLEALPAKHRTVIYLRFYAGESLDGIAALTGCSLGTVKSRLFHALARLAKMQTLKQLQNEHPRTPL